MVPLWLLTSLIGAFALHDEPRTPSSDLFAVSTNIPVLRWQSTVPAATNASEFRIIMHSGLPHAHWDSGWLYRENPHEANASTWPVSATTYSGPPLRPSTKYVWSVQERRGDGGSFGATRSTVLTTAASLPTVIDEARAAVNSNAFSRLWRGQLSNLLARVGADGYLSTSVYGGYTGVYTRDTSAFVLAMTALGDRASLAAGGAALQYMLRVFSAPGLKGHTSAETITLDRAPHCTWSFSRHDAPSDFCPSFGSASCIAQSNCTCFAVGNFSSGQFQDQVDGTAHLLLAFDRWCIAAGEDGDQVATQYYPLMKRFLTTYVGDGTDEPSGPYLNASLGLIWNPGFEGPGSSSYNLLTNFFMVEALRAMAGRAATLGDHGPAVHWQGIEHMLRAGIEANLTMTLDGETVYAMYRSHGGNAVLQTGLSWVAFSPIPAVMSGSGAAALQPSWLNRTRMKSTAAAMQRHASFEWGEPKGDTVNDDSLPVAVSLSAVSSNQTGADFAVIGKGIGWELGWAAVSNDWQRVVALCRWLSTVAGAVPVHCKSSPCAANSSTMLGESYFYKAFLQGSWYFADIGNLEQASWFLWGTNLVRKMLAVDAEMMV